MAESSQNGREQKQGQGSSKEPYVRYILTADINDKGIGFVVQRAIKTFLDNHGYESTVTGLERTSDKYEAVISLFDNGHYDFNMSAFLEHINSSGRLPTKASLKPKVSIKPIPCGQGVVVQQVDHAQDQWVRVTEDLNQKIADRDQTIAGLNVALQNQNKALGEKTARNAKLEAMLSDAPPSRYGSLVEAAINAYLRGSVPEEDLFALAADVSSLQGARNLELFVKEGTRIKNRVGYVNVLTGRSFGSEDELVGWVKDVSSRGGWSESLQVKELEEYTRTIGADEALLKMAQESKASEDAIKALRGIVERKKSGLIELSGKVDSLRAEFERDAALLPVVGDSQKNYELFVSALKNAESRRLVIPALAVLDQKEMAVGVLWPSYEAENPLDALIASGISVNAVLAEMNYSAGKTSFDNGITSLRVSSSSPREDYANRIFSQIVSSNPVSALGAFGANIRFSGIRS